MALIKKTFINLDYGTGLDGDSIKYNAIDSINSKIDTVAGQSTVSFDGAITDPSGEFTGSTVQDFVNIFFQSVDPNVNIGLSPDNSLREFGDDVVDPTISANITLGSNPSADISSIIYKRGSTQIHDGTDTSFQDTYTVSDNTTYSVNIEDTEGRTDNSSKSYSFIYPFFYGITTSGNITDGITEDDIKSLTTKSVSIKGTKSFTSSPDNERFVFLYPASYGNLSSIIDDNGFETISDYNVSTISITSMLDGTDQDYKFYELKSDTTQTNFTNQFKF